MTHDALPGHGTATEQNDKGSLASALRAGLSDWLALALGREWEERAVDLMLAFRPGEGVEVTHHLAREHFLIPRKYALSASFPNVQR